MRSLSLGKSLLDVTQLWVCSEVLKFSQITPDQSRLKGKIHPPILYHQFMNSILEGGDDKVSLAPPISPKSALIYFYSTSTFPRMPFNDGGELVAFDLGGAREQINTLLPASRPLPELWGVSAKPALAQNANCLVAALHCGPVKLLWEVGKEKRYLSLFYGFLPARSLNGPKRRV